MIEHPEVFVVAPFGRKNDGGRDIDFDFVYFNLIAPVARNAGWLPVRADQLFRGEVVVDTVIDGLFRAHLVVADVTMPNPNVYYELGLRHAIAAGGTVLIAHAGTELPFDVAHRRTIFYDLKQPDKFRADFAEFLRQYLVLPERPGTEVTSVLERLGVIVGSKDEARFEQDFSARIERAENKRQLIALWQWARQHEKLPSRQLSELARRLHKERDWKTAAEVLDRATRDRPEDFELRRIFGWTLRKLGRLEEAEQQLRLAVKQNASDPEAWGILGGLLKEQKRFREAAQAYRSSLEYASDDAYILVNLACIEVLLAGEERDQGLERYATLRGRIEKRAPIERDIWTDLTQAEAAFVAGDVAAARNLYRAARQRQGVSWEMDSAVKQLQLFMDYGFRAEEARSLVEEIARAIHRSSTTASVVADEKDVTAELASAATPVFIHLSDLHFGSRLDGAGKRTSMHRFVNTSATKSLVEHLKGEFSVEDGGFNFAADRLHLVVSGDLTYTAGEEEFAEVCRFLDELCSALGIVKERVVIAPGNHDVNWAAAAYKSSVRLDNYLIFLRNFYGRDLAAKLYPKIDWNLDSGATRDPSDIFAIHEMSDGSVQVVSLNSCLLEDEKNHWGFVGELQLEKVRKNLLRRPQRATTPVRIAVVHHHLHPFPEAYNAKSAEPWIDISLVRDSGLVERWIEEDSFSIVMHGHKHKPQLRETIIRGHRDVRVDDGRLLIICGAGSAGVDSRELEHHVGNHYQVIELLRVPRIPGADFVRVTWSELPVDSDVSWKKRPPWIIKG